ncbi:serine/threonine-protein phosphatase [Mycoplasmopsis anatis]|uniref:PP2C family protein-serine/threonine phosphatase n=1 Tax=Mycoplasmopsis anatis TaxID=171279 RepID=UPI001C4DF8CA|nr:protein phosphatase 2C domain-containing protein [Mycoplasmopsis anatis]MBW0594500.1 serine/threonine-protein phosphatase [Mycoplasmopsis anatis]MBW0595237.1 serine/threonine-protein phosphatase [Mycoplasmopsis anatis]MBW0598063.1 serine/threonine-protein phosphatase [Mycoplasmopsis anatis]MBW0598918.1 serine/threonine-protein phosphatase [Mycoplasmopsis anatis]MBW0601095.1 serine/threonine-protein phosphatase [Mycoplasmopsis anatis]
MQWLAKSIKGDFRDENQDRVEIIEKDNTVLALLCDGMGGHFGGSFASSIAVNVIVNEFLNSFNQNLDDHKKWFYDLIDIVKINMKKQSINEEMHDMGTTLTAALIFRKQKKIIIFNSGDSRTYILNKNDDLIQITVDHNYYNQLIQEGYDKIVANSQRESKYLTSALGPSKKTTLEVFELNTESYMKTKSILLTSDGIHGFINNDEIELIVKNSDLSLKSRIETILTSAQIANSNDNMSVAIIDFNEEDYV